MKNITKNKGITLVALVVTIIILLILAGITISQLSGSGLFENAKLAEQKSKETQEKEEGILGGYQNKIGETINGNRDMDEAKIREIFQEELNKKIKSGSATLKRIGGNAGATFAIKFEEPLPDANYNVTVTCTVGGANWASVEYNVTSKTASGFNISAWNNASAATEGVVSVDWILVKQ